MRHLGGTLAAVALLILRCAANSSTDGATQLPAGSSIREAVAGAAPDAVIELGAGIFRESLVIDRSVTLRGAAEGTTIEGTASGPAVRISGTDLRVRLENLTIAGGRGWNGHGIQIEGSSSVHLDAVTSTRNAWCGLWVTDESVVTLSRCRLVENGTHGLYTWDFARIEAQECEISRNCTHAILAFHLSELRLRNCTVSGNLSGVYVWDGVRFHAATTAVTDNALCGLVAQNGSWLDLSECEVSRNGKNGLWFTDSGRGSLSGCAIRANGDDGVFIERDGIVDFVECVVDDNAGFGIRASVPSCTGEFVSGEPYKGWIEGTANVVPGPSDPSGNRLGGLCPIYPGSIWPPGFLSSPQGGGDGP
jgi:nitrous oxidase accessory protein NosD